MILDTTFIIDLMNNLPEAIAKLKQMQKQKESLFVSSVSLFELWSGIAQSDHPDKEKQRVKAVLASQLVLDLTKESAEEAGMINGTLWKNGTPIDPEDSMIAGIAKQYEEKVLTRNIRHFSKVKDLMIERY